MRKTKVGFIGAGSFVSAHHLHTAGHSPSMTVHAVCDLDEKRLAQHKADYKPGYVTKDYQRLLADPEVELVVIGTKQDLHARLIIESLDAGKWVYCEKPMSETNAETAAVLAAERRAKGRLAVGFNRRFAPACVRAKHLLRTQKPPVYLNYRMMWPAPGDDTKHYYADKYHMLYEGAHILDLVCWMLDAVPNKVYMSGDLHSNNVLALDFPKGSRVSFMLGTMGSYALWKEYMEIFSGTAAITVSDFVDMRVRGIPGEFDEVFPAHLGEQAAGIFKHGFDFYEVCRGENVAQACQDRRMGFETVRRPGRDFGSKVFHRQTTYASALVPDKGWVQALEHFARCCITGAGPATADGGAGALTTQLALTAVESLKSRRALDFTFHRPETASVNPMLYQPHAATATVA